MEDTFAFIIHPIDPKRDVSRKFSLLRRMLSERQIDFFSTDFLPTHISEITSAATGKAARGWFLACPYTPRCMLALPERVVYRKIVRPDGWPSGWVRVSLAQGLFPRWSGMPA